jgi:hypothetical protein
MKPRPRRSTAYISIMKLSAATPNRVSIYLGGKRWKRGGMYHMSQCPQRVVLHQQSSAQLQVQLNGLRIRSRTGRPTSAIVGGGRGRAVILREANDPRAARRAL